MIGFSWAELTSTNLVGLNGHFQTAVYALHFHSGHQQTFRADRRSNFGRIPATSVRRTSTKTSAEPGRQLLRYKQRLHSVSHSCSKTRSSRLSSCSSKPEAVRLLLAAVGSHCLLHRNHFSDVKATQHSWINDKFSSKLVSIK